MAEPRPALIVALDPIADAAELLAAALADAEIRSGAPRLAVPGGSAAAALGPLRRALGAVWSRVRLTWVDERCVPLADPASNRGAAYRAGHLDQADPPAIELPLWLDGEDPESALARVAHAWRTDFDSGLDVVLLGMGADGHVASLFPGRELPLGSVAHVADSPKPPPQRMTLTRAALASAGETVLLASGATKRPALARLLEGDPALPAFGLPGLIVVTDAPPPPPKHP